MKQSPLIAGLVLALLASLGFAARLWSWVLDFDPGFAFRHEPVPTGPALSAGVTVLLVDGLRLDASRKMPALNELRARGADIEGRVGTPSFSRPGRATLAVGALPDIHGVTTNRQRRAVSMDNLFRRLGAMGGSCRVSGSSIWPGILGSDIARCGEFLRSESKEGPGTFGTQVPAVRESQEKGLAFVLQEPVTLRIADILSTDFAAHEYGGASAQYAAEVARADRYVKEISDRLDLERETLIVTADHGHRDAGGHGGAEPEVLAIPIVMAGAGIRPRVAAVASQSDIAPTIAALLGIALPGGSGGRPLVPVLAEEAARLDLVNRAAAGQKAAFERAVAARLGQPLNEENGPDGRSLLRAYREAAMSGRTPFAIVFGLMVLGSAGVAIRAARPDSIGLAVGVLTAILAAGAGLAWLLPPFSFSSINYDEMLVPFFTRIVLFAALVTAASMATALWARSLEKNGRTRGSMALLAGGVGLSISAGLVLATNAAWLHHGLLLPLALPAPDRLVESYALTLSVGSAALTSLLALGLLSALEGKGG